VAVKVKFLPGQKVVEVLPGTDLLKAAAQAGVPVEGNCGGKGTCGKCKVRLVSGPVKNLTEAEKKHLSEKELAAGWVLACQRPVWEDVTVEVMGQKDAYARKTSLSSAVDTVEINSSVEKLFLKLNAPTIKDQKADYERVIEGLSLLDESTNLSVLSNLAQVLRRSRFQVTPVTIDGKLIAVEEGDTTGRKFGLVFDIGTTTVVGYLLDLNTGNVVATSALTNPQNVFGADVISRINHVINDKSGLADLQKKVLEAMNEITNQLYHKANVNSEEVYETVVVGNTTMSHLFWGLDPSYLAPAPFIPVFTHTIEAEARELGLNMHPYGRVSILPNIAGYVGSDTVGVMLATHINERKGYTVAVDIGTNGEVVLAGGGRVLTCSTAAGPAFEGAQIQDGMRAADGAIESVYIDRDEVKIEVIGNCRAKGICGSGLIDAVAQMLKAGIIDTSGRFTDPEDADCLLDPKLKTRIIKGNNGFEFILVPADLSATGENIVVSQKDIRELQLGKGAIYAGIQVLMQIMGITPKDISEILLAGAFGNYIKKESAMAIGLFPRVPITRITSVGNAAGDGAKLALLSKKERAAAQELARRAEHVELSSRLDFQNEFVNALGFPE
jgi:uncharacterized 2Fe-2S/4Fe-4S cluster protein (DUF4445 family)